MRTQLPWIVPLDYAKPIVIARALKSRLLRPEVIRELALAKDFDEAVGALGESLYPGIRESKNLLQVNMAVWRGYFRSVYRLADVCPHHLREVALLFAREEELRDLLIIVQKIKSRSLIQERLPSMFHEGTLVYRLTREQEKLISVESLLSSIKDTWAYKYLSEALNLVEEYRLDAPLYVLSTPYIIRMYSETLEPLSGIDIRDLETILCPRLEPSLYASLLQGKARNIPLDVLKSILKPVSICNWNIDYLLESYDRSYDFKSLAEDLGKLAGIRFSGETLDEMLSNILIGGGRRLRKIAYEIMAGDPYRPAFLIAPLVLLRLEVDDILLILSAKVYKVKPEDILPRLSIEI